MPPSLKISDEILDTAADWMVLLHSGDMSNQAQLDFEQWKTQSPEHALAIQHLEQFTQGLSQLPTQINPQTLVNSNQKFKTAVKRNLMLSLSGLVLLGSSLSLLPWDKWQCDLYTQVGEIKNFNLEDGSQLVLASDSYVDIEYTAHTRRIKLIEGEIFIRTAKDVQHRPFLVKTQSGLVEALGTEFTVQQEKNKSTHVEVFQHAVAIHPHKNTHAKILKQGLSASFNDHEISSAQPLQNQQPYWTQHLLVVENWPLDKVLNELYRYQHGIYHLEDDLKKLPVSGVFSLTHPHNSIETLAYTHALELKTYGPYLLNIKKIQKK